MVEKYPAIEETRPLTADMTRPMVEVTTDAAFTTAEITWLATVITTDTIEPTTDSTVWITGMSI